MPPAHGVRVETINPPKGGTPVKKKIIRAWRDEDYLQSLSEEERQDLPASPVGMVDLDDSELHGVAGGVTVSGAPCTTLRSFSGCICFTC